MNDNDALFLGLTNVVELEDLAIVNNVAAVLTIGINAGKNIHQGGLTCAIFAADCHDLTLMNLQIDVIQCLHAGKFLGDVVHFQDVFRHYFISFASDNRSTGKKPESDFLPADRLWMN